MTVDFTGQMTRVRPLLMYSRMLTDPAGLSALTRAIIGCGIRVHREFGPGLFENVYNESLQWELRDQGLRFERERKVPVVYRNHALKSLYYVDLIVEGRVIV